MNLRISSATSGKSSKFDVSSMDRTSTGIAAGRSLICSQSTPRKNDTLFTSSMPFCEPIRRSASQQNRTIVSRASSEIGVSGGKINVSRQFITLRYVSCGSETELPVKLESRDGGSKGLRDTYCRSRMADIPSASRT